MNSLTNNSMNHSTCCEKCLTEAWSNHWCANALCPCHQSAENSAENIGYATASGAPGHSKAPEKGCLNCAMNTQMGGTAKCSLHSEAPTDTAEKKCTCPPPKPFDWKHLEGCPATDTSEKEPGHGYCLTCGLETQPIMKCKCPFRSDSSDWRERFDSKFGDNPLLQMSANRDIYGVGEVVKAFIEKELERARQELLTELKQADNWKEYIKAEIEAERARVRTVIKRLIDNADHISIKGMGYRQALKDLLDALKD